MPDLQAVRDRWVADVLGVDPATYGSGEPASAPSEPPNLLFSPSGPTPPGGGGGVHKNNQTEPKPTPAQIRAVQQSISKWQVENGAAPIKDSGNLDEDTKKAILEFQRNSGLRKQDGAVGPETERRMAILLEILQLNPNVLGWPTLQDFTASPGFGSLDEQTQDEALQRIKTYAHPGTLDNIRLLKKVVMEIGFEQLSDPSKKLLLNVLAARPGDSDLEDNLGQLVASSAFRKLDEATRTTVLRRIKSYGGDRDKVDNIEDMVTATMNFADLSKETQHTMLSAIAGHPGDRALGDSLRRAVDGTLSSAAAGIDFHSFDQETQTSVLTRILNYYPRQPSNVDNLMTFITTPAFQGLSLDVQDDILDGIPDRFPNLQLTPPMVTNMLTLVTHATFEKLPAKYRQLMLDLLSPRPDNAQLVAAFVALLDTPGFQYDRRNAEAKIRDADAKTP